MRILLMNSAMMPVSGTYKCQYVDQDSFVKAFRKAYAKAKNFMSFIGYASTASHLTNILEVEVPENRSNTDMKSGDIIFVCKLEGRVPDPSTKGQEQNIPFAYAIITLK